MIVCCFMLLQSWKTLYHGSFWITHTEQEPGFRGFVVGTETLILCKRQHKFDARRLLLQMVGTQLSWNSCAWKPVARECKGLDWLQAALVDAKRDEVCQWCKLQICKFDLVVHGCLWQSCAKPLWSISRQRQCGFQKICVRHANAQLLLMKWLFVVFQILRLSLVWIVWIWTSLHIMVVCPQPKCLLLNRLSTRILVFDVVM